MGTSFILVQAACWLSICVAALIRAVSAVVSSKDYTGRAVKYRQGDIVEVDVPGVPQDPRDARYITRRALFRAVTFLAAIRPSARVTVRVRAVGAVVRAEDVNCRAVKLSQRDVGEVCNGRGDAAGWGVLGTNR